MNGLCVMSGCEMQWKQNAKERRPRGEKRKSSQGLLASEAVLMLV